MNIIYKYPLKLVDTQIFELPMGADILTVQNQNDVICLWALVNTKRPKIKRKIQIIGTGNKIDIDLHSYIFLNTTQINGFVWHIFIEINNR